MARRLAWLVVVGAAGSNAAIAAIGRLGRDWDARVAVRGHSMEPSLLEGDWLLVDPSAYALRAPAMGELVVARDPRDERRVIIKRVIDTHEGTVLGSDNPAHAGERIGPVAGAQLMGRPWFRYWPTERVGRVR